MVEALSKFVTAREAQLYSAIVLLVAAAAVAPYGFQTFAVVDLSRAGLLTLSLLLYGVKLLLDHHSGPADAKEDHGLLYAFATSKLSEKVLLLTALFFLLESAVFYGVFAGAATAHQVSGLAIAFLGLGLGALALLIEAAERPLRLS